MAGPPPLSARSVLPWTPFCARLGLTPGAPQALSGQRWGAGFQMTFRVVGTPSARARESCAQPEGRTPFLWNFE